MFLGEFRNSADACNIYDARRVLRCLSPGCIEQTQESVRDIIDRESVDLVEVCPVVKGIIVKHSLPKSRCVFALWCVLRVKEWRGGTDLSSTI